MFKFYSRASCFYECHRKTAKAFTNCTAWNQPHFSPTDQFCVKSSVGAFSETMGGSSSPCFANCLPDCQGTKYDPTYSLLLSNPEVECGKEEVMVAALKNINLVGDRSIINNFLPIKNAKILNF